MVDPSSVTVLSQIEHEDVDQASSSHNISADLSLPQPSFCKELQELDNKWSIRMVRLEALLMLGQRTTPQPSFSPVKLPVNHKSPAGALSQIPFLISFVPSSKADPASTPDRTHISTVDMSSPLENLYPETGPELVFAQPGHALAMDYSSGPLLVSDRDIAQPEQTEEGELSDLDNQPDPDTTDLDKTLCEDHNYRETVSGVRAFMDWNHIPDLEYSPVTRADNPWIGHCSQPVGKISVLLPPEDWLCKNWRTGILS